MNRLLLIILLCWQIPIYAQSKIQKLTTEFANDTIFQSAIVGISLRDISTGRELVKYNATKSLHTASLLKLITTATVLSQKPSNWQYKTPIGHSGQIKNEILTGDIVIIGNGDPSFNSKYFPNRNTVEKIITILKKRNIKQIKGNLILDNTAFVSEIPPTWIWEDLANYYGATCKPINFHDNLYILSLQSKSIGSIATVLNSNPKQKLDFLSEVRASKSNRDNAYIFGSPLSDKRTIKGTIPANRKRFDIKGVIPQPEKSLGEALLSEFTKNNISILGKLKVEKSSDFHQLGTILSPSLSAITTQTNRKSINLYAEALLYLVDNNTNSRTRSSQIKATVDFWKQQGLNTSSLIMHDGCGLSPLNATSPEFFTALLNKMNSNKAFKNSLSIAGANGTLRWFGRNTPIEKHFIGKTGTMQQVCGYAGYLTLSSGKEYSLTILVNNHNSPNKIIRKRIEKYLNKIYQSLRSIK